MSTGESARADATGGSGSVRLWSLAILLVCLAPLLVAGWLRPDRRGYGTHQQLGFGPCGMLLSTGYPCPTCGMTTAFALAVRGDLLRSAHAQPGGLALALLAAAAAVLSLRSLITGREPLRILLWLTPLRLVLILLMILLGGWGYKMLTGHLDGTLPVRQLPLQPTVR